jgi:hypothetical protein
MILDNETKYYANFLIKRWLFSILYFGLQKTKKAKRILRDPNKKNKFYILDVTKCNPKYLVFYILLHIMEN